MTVGGVSSAYGLYPQTETKTKQTVSAADGKTEVTDYRKIIQEHIEMLYEKIKSGDTEPSYQIGGQSFTEKEWEKLLESFDSAEAAIKELVEEEIEQRKKAEEEKITEVDNDSYTIQKGADDTIKIYDKITGYTYTFLEKYLSIQTDTETGMQFLISDIPYTTMNVEAMYLTPELKAAISQYRNGEAIKEQELDEKFTLTKDSTTGILALHWRSGDIEASVMLMSTAEQKKKLEELAATYLKQYPNLVANQWEAELYASLEAKGNARRTANGILKIGGNGVTYDDNGDYGNNTSDFSHCWTYFLNTKLSDENYMTLMKELRGAMLSATEETLEQKSSFMEALSKQQKKTDELSKVQLDMLTSETVQARFPLQAVDEEGNQLEELYVIAIDENGIRCSKPGAEDYEWEIVFTDVEQYQKTTAFLNWAKENMDNFLFAAHENFWKDYLNGTMDVTGFQDFLSSTNNGIPDYSVTVGNSMYIDTAKMKWAQYMNPLGTKFYTAEEMLQLQRETIEKNLTKTRKIGQV
jgi:hypothetical protein